MDLHLPISIFLALRKFAKSKIQPYYQEFKLSRGRLQSFRQHHGLTLRRRFSISQKFPKQLENKFFTRCMPNFKNQKISSSIHR